MLLETQNALHSDMGKAFVRKLKGKKLSAALALADPWLQVILELPLMCHAKTFKSARCCPDRRQRTQRRSAAEHSGNRVGALSPASEKGFIVRPVCVFFKQEGK